jgi:hypothetical protein
MLLTTKDLVDSVARLNKAASPEAAGLARARFLSSLTTLKEKHGDQRPVLNFPFGNTNILVNSAGQQIVPDDARSVIKRTGWLNDDGWMDIDRGSAPTNKMIYDVRIPAGLCLIVGAAAAGKTPLAHALAGHGGATYHVARYGEPLAGYETNEESAAVQVAHAIVNGYDVVLDSVKDILSLMSGAAMKSGLSREVLPLFSRWSTIAADAGVTLYVPVNPSSPDEEVVDLLVEATKSNATMTIHSSGGDSWSYVARRGEGLKREQGSFTARYNSQGLVDIHSGASSAASSREYITSNITGDDISDSAFAASLRRSVLASAD